MYCLLKKLITIMSSQLGVLPKPHMNHPKGIKIPYLAKNPSIGCRAPVYSGCSSHALSFTVLTMSFAVTSVMLSRTMRMGVGGVGAEPERGFRGTAKCQRVGRLADQAVQRTSCLSQSRRPRRGQEGRALRMGTDRCSKQTRSVRFVVWRGETVCLHSTPRQLGHNARNSSCSRR